MPKKYKVRQNSKVKINSLMDDWLAGKNHKFHSGQVVCSKRDENYIGVIQFALATLETYRIKWKTGKNSWEFLEGTVSCSDVVANPNTPNPFKYKWSEVVPGPSSDEIDRLEVIFAKRELEKKNKPKTSKDVEEYISYLEEDLHKRKSTELDETTADSIVDETLEEDTELPVDSESLNKKIMGIIEEE